MNDYMKEALAIVRAQAGVRVMSEDEIMAMVKKIADGLENVSKTAPTDGDPCVYETENAAVEPRKSIKEKSITCLECGKSFKILTRRHLEGHGLDVAAYREKWGFKKNTPLVCKGLQRERRKKMKDMALWERRRRTEAAETVAPAPKAE